MATEAAGWPSAASPGLPYRTESDLVTEYLPTELQAGRPKPGQRLVVAQVAAALGVSKVPVREAVTDWSVKGCWCSTRTSGRSSPPTRSSKRP